MSDSESGWGTSALWYGLAILFLIIAVICTLWRAFRRCDDDDDKDKKSDRDRNFQLLCLWLAVAVFALLCLCQQNYDARSM